MPSNNTTDEAIATATTITTAVCGLAVCLRGSRFTRLYCFVLGFLIGAAATQWFFESQTEVRHEGVPLIIGLLVSLMVGMICLLMHMATMAAILGSSIASVIMVADNRIFFGYYRELVYLICILCGVLYTFRRPSKSLIVTTSLSGALITSLSIDSMASRSVGALIFQDSFLELPLEVESAVARCFTWECWVMLPFLLVCALGGYWTQTKAEGIRAWEEKWPILTAAQKQPNFTPRTRQAESLLQEDKNYTIASYASYDNFRAHSQAAQAAQAQSQAQAQAAAQHPVPIAAPELGSAHADDKVVLPPVAKAAFNFFDLHRLPPHQHYLYLVIHNAFLGLQRMFGFQTDNMKNQYEHLIFLLCNQQSRGQNAAGSSSGSTGSTPGLSAAPAPNDSITQLHNKLLSNYRGWIAYMNRGGNSAMGGSAISTDSNPLFKSAIQDAVADRHTTDSKLEEMCLWLLVWGEAGSLRHTPECLAYIFHRVATENKQWHHRTAGGVTLDVHANVASRPSRREGDFLRYVIQPIYQVIAEENKKPDAVRKNYDDINEFFWRKSCINYYYADTKYKIAGAGGDVEAGGGGRGATMTVAQALRASKKSFLEKRSWLHPVRSFMRLLTFYFVCFHLLVAISYIHYINLPLMSAASNRILSSFVISLAGWSCLKEVFEIWATYGIISESVWNSIGFIMRIAIKTSMLLCLTLFYLWSIENDDPYFQAQYWNAYLLVACLYMVPIGVSILMQLFPTLAHQLSRANIPFVDEISKFWYPVNKLYVGRDVHEPEQAIYKYQVFWVLLLLWKMYLSLIFQISPLIEPTIDILARISRLSISIHLYQRWLYYGEVVLLWTPFVLVYLFDTIIWYFLWQALVGISVGMREHLGEIRAFSQLIRCFQEMPRMFDEKIVWTNKKMEQTNQPTLPAVGAAAIMRQDSLRQRGRASATRTAELSADQTRGLTSPRQSNLAQPLTMALGRRGSVGGSTTSSTTSLASTTSNTANAPTFRNMAWENFAVAWNEVVEDLRLGDLLSNQERQMLRFRFDTTTVQEYYLPLFLLVGHVDAAIGKCTDVQKEWNEKLKSGGAFHGRDLARMERGLVRHFDEYALRGECVSEIWELVRWLLTTLLGGRHAPTLHRTFAAIYELLLVQSHVLRGTNLSTLPKIKSDLLNLVRSLRIASASYHSLKLAEAAKKDEREREEEEKAELEREIQKRLKADATAEAEAAQDSAEDEGFDSDSDVRMARKKVIVEAERSTLSSSLQSARDNNLETMMRSPSVATLSMLEQLQTRPRHRSAAFVPERGDKAEHGYLILHISLIRDHLSSLLHSLASAFNPKYNDELRPDSNWSRTGVMSMNPNVLRDIINPIKSVSVQNDGFMWDGTYAGKQIHSLLQNSKTNNVLSTLHSLLTVASIDAAPKNSEATRRLLFFSNSLFMDLPVAPSIRGMKSMSTLTPFHSEDVLYSLSDLEKKTEDGVSVFLYLQTIYPLEWQNFLQRCGIPESTFQGGSSPSRLLANNKKHALEARLWATMRGQTLGRTVDGMMLYEKAIKLLLKLEEPNSVHIGSGGSSSSSGATGGNSEWIDAALLSQLKYQYILSCQVYGKQKRENDPKAADIEFLLHRHPSLRVAYIDTEKVPYASHPGSTLVKEKYSSVLIKSERNPVTGHSEIKEVYRIELPGNPVLGEGKPENQNHAIVFTRGEFLQTIDMNQSNYLEEALKMRNLLEEFDTVPGEKQAAIVGFREHIYTGGLSSIANYMALQEGTFVTQGQRVLDDPLRVRFHYGHPDVFSKLFFMSRGGVSKASKGINLSEDIFAGFNSVLRGGAVKFREYVQCGKGRDVGLQQLFKFEAKLAQGNAMQSISRDVYRLANTMDFFRLMGFYFGGVGFYISNCLTIWALYLFVYSRLILGGFRLESLDSFSGANTISYWFGMIGFLLTLPIFATIGLEKGFRKSILEVARAIATGFPIFAIFHMGTKSFYFEQTMLAGGAKYRPTGRGFVTRHERFAEIYRFHAASHFYRSVELILALLLYLIVIPPTFNYSLVTWAGWLIVAAWLFGPFWFNPLGFEWEKTIQDFSDFSSWMARKEGDINQSWRSWWKDEFGYIQTLDTSSKVGLCVMQLRYLILAASLIYFVQASRHQAMEAGITLVLLLLSVLFVRAHVGLRQQFVMRIVKAVLVVALLLFLFMLLSVDPLSWHQWFQLTVSLIALTYAFHALANVALICGLQDFHWLRQYFKLVDWLIAGSIFVILGLLSVTVIPSIIQTRLMFHNAFSRGVLIDKLLKTKPDDEAAATGARAASAPSRDKSKGKGKGKGKGGHDGSSDEENLPSLGGSVHGFDLDAISFIERRTKKNGKKLHPSKEQAAGVGTRAAYETPSEAHIQTDESSSAGSSASATTTPSSASSTTTTTNTGGSKKGVAFSGSTSTSAPRKAPSISSLPDLLEKDESATPSPDLRAQQRSLPTTPHLSGGATASPSVGPSSRATGGANAGAAYPPASRATILSSMTRAVTGDALSPTATSTTPTLSPLPPAFPPTISAGQPLRSAGTTPSPVFGHPSAQSSPVGSSASPSLSPSPSSPSPFRSSRLPALPAAAKQDERPIPKTLTQAQFSSSVTKSPLNPRRA